MNINSYADGNLSCCVINTGVLKFMSVVTSSHYPIITGLVRTRQVWCTVDKIR